MSQCFNQIEARLTIQTTLCANSGTCQNNGTNTDIIANGADCNITDRKLPQYVNPVCTIESDLIPDQEPERQPQLPLLQRPVREHE